MHIQISLADMIKHEKHLFLMYVKNFAESNEPPTYSETEPSTEQSTEQSTEPPTQPPLG